MRGGERGSVWWAVVGLVVAGCNGWDEVTCELEVEGVTVCVDLHDKRYCEAEWGGEASNAELEPGGPYAYCRDLYTTDCTGTLLEEGENFTAEHNFYAASEEDCATAEGGSIGGQP